MANAREKRNLGGKDSSGSATGHTIRQRALEKLADHITNDDMLLYRDMELDTFEVNGKWWLDHAEKGAEVKERMVELLTQIRFAQDERVVLVGHSHFFRELMRSFMDSESCEASGNSELCDALRSNVIENCAVVAVKLKFAESGNDVSGCIKGVEMLFGTKVKADKAKGTGSNSSGSDRDSDDDTTSRSASGVRSKST